MMLPDVIQQNIDYLLWGNLEQGSPGGLLLTLEISLSAGAIALMLGLIWGIILSLFNPASLRLLTTLLRSIPVLMLIFWCYFLLPMLLHTDIPGLLTVILALGVINAAYIGIATESGIRAVSSGQWEAGLSLGMSRFSTLRHIILPQALRIMQPSFINQGVTLIKDSSLAYVVGVAELTFVATQVNNREQVYPLQIFAFIGISYFIICSTLELLGTWLNRRQASHHAR